jgi:diguanylate cyclase (GGDEF)-like protein
LILLSQLLKRICRKNDLSSRFGGDEFTILANFTNKAGAEIMIGRFRDLLNKENVGGTDMTLSIAVGVAGYPDNGGDIETLLKIADNEMYKNKKEMKMSK